jgi:hypothetical protein
VASHPVPTPSSAAVSHPEDEDVQRWISRTAEVHVNMLDLNWTCFGQKRTPVTERLLYLTRVIAVCPPEDLVHCMVIQKEGLFVSPISVNVLLMQGNTWL